MKTVHFFKTRAALMERLRVRPTGDFTVNLMLSKHEHANGEVHLFKVLTDINSVHDICAIRADEVIVHGLLCSEHLPEAVFHLRPKTVKFEP